MDADYADYTAVYHLHTSYGSSSFWPLDVLPDHTRDVSPPTEQDYLSGEHEESCPSRNRGLYVQYDLGQPLEVRRGVFDPSIWRLPYAEQGPFVDVEDLTAPPKTPPSEAQDNKETQAMQSPAKRKPSSPTKPSAAPATPKPKTPRRKPSSRKLSGKPGAAQVATPKTPRRKPSSHNLSENLKAIQIGTPKTPRRRISRPAISKTHS